MKFDLKAFQAALQDLGFDGWLLYDFRGANVLAERVLALDPDRHSTRRWCYAIPAVGEPRKLVHRIESGALDHLPGEKHVYLKWQEFEAGLATLAKGMRRVAMEYAPRASNPYVSRVDAGTVELVKSLGVEVASSGDLVQLFESTWSDDQWRMHQEAAVHTQAAFEMAWRHLADTIRSGGISSEVTVQRLIMEHFAAHGLLTDHPPIVGVNEHSADPHFAPSVADDRPIRRGDFVLIDLWAKLNRPRAVYSDLTQVGFMGEAIPQEIAAVFEIVARGRDAAIHLVRESLSHGHVLQGWEVDQACRDVIDAAGYGEFFIHRTGHSIGQETHGNGANMDNLETHEERRVMRRTCFSVEPGIYLPGRFGIRSEVNVFVDSSGQVHVTGGHPQTSVRAVMNS